VSSLVGSTGISPRFWRLELSPSNRWLHVLGQMPSVIPERSFSIVLVSGKSRNCEVVELIGGLSSRLQS